MGTLIVIRARLTLVYFRLGKLQRVSTYVQQMWGIIGHVTVEAGSPVGTDGAPPQNLFYKCQQAPIYLHPYLQLFVQKNTKKDIQAPREVGSLTRDFHLKGFL